MEPRIYLLNDKDNTFEIHSRYLEHCTYLQNENNYQSQLDFCSEIVRRFCWGIKIIIFLSSAKRFNFPSEIVSN